MVFVGLCPEAPEGPPAVVLISNRLSRRGHGLKSYQTDWEKPGIEPAIPGLQDIGLSPTHVFLSLKVVLMVANISPSTDIVYQFEIQFLEYLC